MDAWKDISSHVLVILPRLLLEYIYDPIWNLKKGVPSKNIV